VRRRSCSIGESADIPIRIIEYLMYYQVRFKTRLERSTTPLGPILRPFADSRSKGPWRVNGVFEVYLSRS